MSKRRQARLGEIAFIAGWSVDRRRRFVADLREVAFHALATNDFDEIDVFLDASRPRLATGVVDPAQSQQLLTPGSSLSSQLRPVEPFQSMLQTQPD